jgi:cellobiose dehydrogenase (acceptor)
MKTLLLERGGPMLYRDGNREIPFWSLQKYAGNNLTRHDAMAYSSTHFQRYPDSRSYYCNNIPLNQLAACQLGGGTAINGAQQFCPPRQYIDTAFGFAGWTFLDFKHAIRRVAARIPPTTYWSTDHEVKIYQPLNGEI